MNLLPADVFKPEVATFIIGGGPSISDQLLAPLRGHQMITVNQAYKLFGDAAVHFSSDERWWARERDEFMRVFKGQYIATCRTSDQERMPNSPEGIPNYLQTYSQKPEHKYHRDFGFEPRPDMLRGNNSGALAINLSYHLGARLVCLLGFDMKNKDGRGHWYITKHDDTDAPFNNFYIPAIESMAPEAAKAGMRIINCTPDSALDCFTKGDFEDYL